MLFAQLFAPLLARDCLKRVLLAVLLDMRMMFALLLAQNCWRTLAYASSNINLR